MISDEKAEGGQSRSGFVALIGRPNVGKSTFLNGAVGEKVSITSEKPQTTRNRVSGVVNRGETQLVFIDTPGIHDSPRLMNTAMNREALSSLGEVDAVVFMVDSAHGLKDGDTAIRQRLANVKAPLILAVNKVDAGKSRGGDFAPLGQFDRVFEISAIDPESLNGLLDYLSSLMPTGPHYYPDDILTDRPERFIAQEFIREKVFKLTGDEIPYATAVTVDSWEEKPDRNLVVIHATIHVERKSQKAIIIGAGGSLIKRIGKAARQDLEGLLGLRIFLDLHVGVEHNWTKDEAQLRRFGLKE